MLAQRIADQATACFESVSLKAGKPGVRSNGVAEWTVLAAVVAVENDVPSVVTLATGVKTMPNEIRAFSEGCFVHDLHAEILCLRAFNRYLMQEVTGETPLKYLEKSSDPAHKHSWRSDVSLALYISEPPCGDCSMGQWDGDPWEKRDEVTSHVKSHISHKDHVDHVKRQKVVRGRSHFHDVGLVRTKPGRLDSKVSFSKSCSDKLALKQYTGVLNAVSSHVIEPVHLTYLVLDDSKYNPADFKRCFETRLPLERPFPLIPLPYTKNHFAYSKSSDQVPSPSSTVYFAVTKEGHVITNGVKNGGYVKNKKPKPSAMSSVCRKSLYMQASAKLPQFTSYSELKASNSERQELKERVRSSLSSWPRSSDDSFSLESSDIETRSCKTERQKDRDRKE